MQAAQQRPGAKLIGERREPGNDRRPWRSGSRKSSPRCATASAARARTSALSPARHALMRARSARFASRMSDELLTPAAIEPDRAAWRKKRKAAEPHKPFERRSRWVPTSVGGRRVSEATASVRDSSLADLIGPRVFARDAPRSPAWTNLRRVRKKAMRGFVVFAAIALAESTAWRSCGSALAVQDVVQRIRAPRRCDRAPGPGFPPAAAAAP